jgi:phosphate/sulfate permease
MMSFIAASVGTFIGGIIGIVFTGIIAFLCTAFICTNELKNYEDLIFKFILFPSVIGGIIGIIVYKLSRYVTIKSINCIDRILTKYIQSRK